MGKRSASPVEAYFLTDPLCPWSWAMESTVASLRSHGEVEFHSIMAAWLPSLAAKGTEAAKAEWTEAAKTGARIDPTYWDRVAPSTSLVAMAAVKAAEFQGIVRGDTYLEAIRRAVFEHAEDATNFDTLVRLAEPSGLNEDLFRIDLGVGRYGVDDVVNGLDPTRPLSDGVWWFGRRRMLRSWLVLAQDLENAERQGLAPPALHFLHGKKEAVVRGFATSAQVDAALASVR